MLTSLTTLLVIIKDISGPKSAAVGDVDIADILCQKYRYCIDIGKGDIDSPLVYIVCAELTWCSPVWTSRAAEQSGWMAIWTRLEFCFAYVCCFYKLLHSFLCCRLVAVIFGFTSTSTWLVRKTVFCTNQVIGWKICLQNESYNVSNGTLNATAP